MLQTVDNVSNDIEKLRRLGKYYYARKSRNLPPLENGQLNPSQNSVWTKGTIQIKLSDRLFMVNVNAVSFIVGIHAI